MLARRTIADRHGRRLHSGSAARAQGLQGLEHRDDARARPARASHLCAGPGRPLLGPERDPRVRAGADAADDDHDWYRAGEPETRPLTDFTAVIMRKDPPFDMEYVYSTYLLENAEREGARVYNRPRAIRDNNEKMAITKYAGFISPTLVTRDAARIDAFVDEHEDVIIKPLDGMGGSSIFRIRKADPNRNVIVETVSHLGAADGHGAALHSRDRRRRQAHPGDRRGSRALRARPRSPSPARRAATWRPAGGAKPGRSPTANAKSPRRWARSSGRRAC